MVSEDQKALAFATLVPGAAFAAGYGAYFGGDIREFYKKCKKPSWVGECETPYMIADTLSVVGPAVAAYKVYKLGGFNYEDTKCALSLYAATYLVGGGAAICAMKQKSFPKAVWANVLYCGLAHATMLSMYSVDKKAGLYCMPLAFWTFIGVLFAISMCHENPDNK